MRRAALIAITFVSVGIAALSALAWMRRASLPYNSEGRYFDAADPVVYSDSGVVVFAALTLLFAALAAVTAFVALRAWPK